MVVEVMAMEEIAVDAQVQDAAELAVGLIITSFIVLIMGGANIPKTHVGIQLAENRMHLQHWLSQKKPIISASRGKFLIKMSHKTEKMNLWFFIRDMLLWKEQLKPPVLVRFLPLLTQQHWTLPCLLSPILLIQVPQVT